jgi:hypothetical protein
LGLKYSKKQQRKASSGTRTPTIDIKGCDRFRRKAHPEFRVYLSSERVKFEKILGHKKEITLEY